VAAIFSRRRPALAASLSEALRATGLPELRCNGFTCHSAFADAAAQRAGAVIIAADAFSSGQGQRIAASALQHRLATISLYEDHVAAGCLMNYGQNVA
jgi:predicted amidohydrolase